jgi:hypothetical protein
MYSVSVGDFEERDHLEDPDVDKIYIKILKTSVGR